MIPPDVRKKHIQQMIDMDTSMITINRTVRTRSLSGGFDTERIVLDPQPVRIVVEKTDKQVNVRESGIDERSPFYLLAPHTTELKADASHTDVFTCAYGTFEINKVQPHRSLGVVCGYYAYVKGVISDDNERRYRKGD